MDLLSKMYTLTDEVLWLMIIYNNDDVWLEQEDIQKNDKVTSGKGEQKKTEDWE